MAQLEGSATHDTFKRSKKGTPFYSIYQATKADSKAFYDQSIIYDMETKYEMLKSGYALIRHIDEIHELMKAYPWPCKIMFPKGLINYELK